MMVDLKGNPIWSWNPKTAFRGAGYGLDPSRRIAQFLTPMRLATCHTSLCIAARPPAPQPFFLHPPFTIAYAITTTHPRNINTPSIKPGYPLPSHPPENPILPHKHINDAVFSCHGSTPQRGHSVNSSKQKLNQSINQPIYQIILSTNQINKFI